MESVSIKKEYRLPSGKKVLVVGKNASEKSLLQSGVITDSDAEMDKRARIAIKTAINKTKVLGKPVAVYDVKTKKSYLEYSDGKREEIR